MGSNLPADRNPAIEWLAARLERWEANAGDIGLDEADVADLAALADQAAQARTRAGEARASARSMTRHWHLRADATMDRARELILKIKAHAAATDNPEVYALAALSAPATRRREGEGPQPPRDIAAELRPGGAVALSWEGGGPRGAFYIVHRRLVGEASERIIAVVAAKRFVDETLPADPGTVRYRIDAQRGQAVAEGPVRLVRLGTIEAAAPAKGVAKGAATDAGAKKGPSAA